MRVFWPVTLVGALLVGLLAYGVASKSKPDTLGQRVADGQRPAAPLERLPRLGRSGDGSLADYRGKVVVLNVWASWCPPCREELPLLQRTQARIAPQGATVLGVDTQDDQEDALAFLAKHKATFPSLRDRDRTYGQRFGVTGYPETFVIDRQGRVRALNRGTVTDGWLRKTVDPLLKESS